MGSTWEFTITDMLILNMYILILGIIQFTQMIVALEKEDDVIADLHSQVRAHYLPPVNIANDVSLWQK